MLVTINLANVMPNNNQYCSKAKMNCQKDKFVKKMHDYR